ncbi:MAG: YDG domain-containing protein [Burkholderiales bacterium]|nr:YDG domain-containing protein [Burkholderiales bacterium]
MNKTFTLVWSAARSAFIVAHEHAKSHGKPSSTSKSAATAAVLLGLLGNAGFALAGPPVVPPVNALPTGGQVAAGAASITQSATRMDINQSTQKAILNWQSFNIGADAQVNFAQPSASAVALNRVLSSDPSAIYGKLSANGQVFLLNPNGVLFGASARVDVGGLVASTMKLDDADFMAGSYKFSGGSGSVINQGNLTAAQGGYIALLSPEVRNEGVISASLGTVVLGGAEAVTLSVDATGLSYVVDKGAVQALVENKGLVQADGGQVILSARSANELASAVINNSGTIEAKGLVSKGGKIVLEGDHITLASGSTLDASGTTGGGTVLVGGDWQGSGTMHQANTVTMEQGATIDIRATKVGAGGTAVLWSDIRKEGSVTKVDGEILAKGGSETANTENTGGKVETSGHKLTIGDSAKVNTSGAINGLWLLDPYDFTIGTDITGANLQTALGSGNVSITTLAGSAACTGATCGAGTTSGSGDIIFNDAVSWSHNTLTLSAYRNIAVNNTLAVSGNAGLTLTTNTGAATGKDIGYLKMQQGAGSFGGKVNWTSSGALSMNSNTYTKVSTQTELAAVTGSGKYFLADNIALTGTWAPLTDVTGFSGVLDGLGHTLSNLTNSSAATINQGLFSKITGATIQNLGITSGTVSGGDSVGGFAGWAHGTNYLRNLFTTSGLTISPNGAATRKNIGGIIGNVLGGTTYLVDTTNGANINSPVGATGVLTNVGGLVGYAGGTLFLKASSNTGTIIGGTVANKDNWTATTLGYSVGGIVGDGTAEMNNSSRSDGITNSGAVYGWTWVGGIVGSWFPSSASYVTNSGSINGGEMIGGIAGRASGGPASTITYAANQGNITGNTTIGGLFGHFSTSTSSYNITLSKSYNQGAVLGKQWGKVGGLVGDASTVYQTELKVEYSYNTGSVTNDNSNNGGAGETGSLVGGIFGEADNAGGVSTTYVRTLNVYNTGTITGGATAKVGGIAGKLGFYTANWSATGAAMFNPDATTYVLSGSVVGGANGASASIGEMYGGVGSSPVNAQTAAFIKTTTNYTGSVYSVIAGVNGGYPIITDFAPVTPVTFTFLKNTTKTYGVADPALVAGTDFSLTGCSACLTLSFNNTTLGQWANAGDYLYSTSNLFTLGGSSSGYSISYAGTAYKMTVNPATLTVSGAAINNKTYTGTNTATFSSQGSLAGVLNSDAVSINAGTTTASFASVNKADGIAVTTSYALTGAKAGNYTVTNPAGLTANITAAPLTIAASNRTKSYGDGLTLGTGSFTPTGLQNLETIGGVTLAATGGTAAADNAGSYTITPSAATGGSFTASNYSITYTPNSGALTVSPATITLKANDRTKTYGSALTLGTTAYGITVGSLKNSDTITGLTLAASGGTADVDAVAGYTITPSAASGTGGFNTSNYTISYSTGALTVNKAPLTVTAANASKTYDGAAYSGGNGVSYSGFVLSQDFNALGGALSYAGTAQSATNAGSYLITPQGYTSGNYSFNYVNGTLTVDKKTVTLSAAKTYDGNTTLGASTVTLGTGISGQALTYSGATSFSKNVADNATNYISALTLVSGTGTASNYQLPTLNAANAPVTLTKKDVSITSLNITDKVYDGTANASSVQSTVLSGVVAGDSANVNTSGTLAAFGAKDVGTYSISVTGLALTGSEAGNYNLTGGTTATDASVAITKKTVTLSASKTYDGTTSLSGFVTLGTGVTVGGFTETLTYTGAVANSSHVAANASNFVANGIALDNASDASGGLARNYQLPVLNHANAPVTISARSITPTLTNSGTTKAYNGDVTTTITPTYSFTNLAPNDTAATLNNNSKIFNSKDAGVATLVTVSGLAITGITGTNSSPSVASDYALSTSSLTTPATITPKTLTVSGLASSNKVYDGTTNVSISSWGSVSTGVDSGAGTETLVLTPGTASFADKNKADAIVVTASGYALSNGSNNGLASNYSLSSNSTTTTANITAKTVTLSASKTYDGSTSLTGNVTVGTGVGSETLAYTGATANDAHVATGSKYINAITLANATDASGGLASNYQLPSLAAYSAGVNSVTIATRPITITADTKSKVYGNTDPSLTYTPEAAGSNRGLVTGDTFTGSLTRATGETVAAGPYAIAQNVALANSDYAVSFTGANLTITQRPITLTATSATKVYGENEAALGVTASATGAGVGIATTANSNTVNDTLAEIAGTLTRQSGNNVGAYDVQLGSGSKAANYNISFVTDNNAYSVTRRPVAVTADAKSKTYGDADPALTFVTEIQSSGRGIFGSETISGALTRASGETVLGGPYQIQQGGVTNANNGNYDISYTPANLTINTKTVTLSASKTYDGSASLTGNVTVGTGVGSETLTYTGAVANDAHVATGSKYISSITLADGSNGGVASNYALPTLDVAHAPVTIGTRSITPALTNAGTTKVYDGDVTTSITPTYNFTNLAPNDTAATLSNTSKVYNSKDVTAANLVTVSGLAITGITGSNSSAASDYTLSTASVTATATITPKALSASVAAPDKVYNGNTSATPTMTITAGLVGTETLGTSATASFNSKDVTTANLVTVNSVNLTDGSNGGLASNYSLAAGETVAAHITAKALSASVAAPDKVYNGNTTASPTLSISAGLVGSETLGTSATATFNTKDVTTANLVTVNSVSLADGSNGGLASNYSLAAGETVAAHITAKALTATVAAPDKVYNGNTTATPTMTITAGLVGSETLGTSATATFNTKDVTTANLVTVNSVSLADGSNGGLASNYSLAAGETVAAHITPKALTVSGITASTKEYDSNAVAFVSTAGVTPAVLQGGGLVAGDAFSVSATGTFRNAGNTADDKNVGVGKTVALTSTYSGADVSNYSVTNQATTNASITQKALSLSGITVADKVYDGNRMATVSTTGASYTGLISGDALSVAATGQFDTKNVGTGKTVTLLSSYSGADVGNYAITDQQSTTASITPKALAITGILTISGITAADKVYDGTRNATVSTQNVLYGGLVTGDQLSVAATGQFDTKNVGAGKTVALFSSYSGNDVGNYNITDQQSTTASITAKPLSVSGVTVAGKVYDGNTTASTNTSAAAYSGLVSGDALVVAATGTFDNKNVGAGKTVTLASTYSGADVGNYTITNQASTTADVTKKTLGVSGITAASKVYDGNNLATVITGSAAPTTVWSVATVWAWRPPGCLTARTSEPARRSH